MKQRTLYLEMIMIFNKNNFFIINDDDNNDRCRLHKTRYIVIIIIIISNGNRTEWSPIRSVIIRVINKIGRPRSGGPICLITSMITERIGRHEVLLPINHNLTKFVI